jgi:hypothetical protein
MKKTKLTWLYFVLQLVFMLVAPCIMIWVQYGDLSQKYKISVTAIILLLLVFIIFKKIVLNKWIKTFDAKVINIETNALSLTDKTAIESNKKAWRVYSLLQLFFSAIIPVLLMVLAIVTIKTVEQGLIKLYGCLMFCAISIIIGILFRIAEIYSMKLKHEE